MKNEVPSETKPVVVDGPQLESSSCPSHRASAYNININTITSTSHPTPKQLTLCPDGSVKSGSEENIDLSRLGLESHTKRDIGMISIIALGWNICNSWAAVAATMILSITSGGPVTLLYGIVVIFVLNGSAAASMAEIASVYPTAGGQYHWTGVLAPKKWSRGLVRDSRDGGRFEADVMCVELLLRVCQLARLGCHDGRVRRHHRPARNWYGNLYAPELYRRVMARLPNLPACQYHVCAVQHVHHEEDVVDP